MTGQARNLRLRATTATSEARLDQLFVATPSEAEIGETLTMWPELSGLRLRPLLVTAFGDVFVETADGDVRVVSAIDISCEAVAPSVAN